MSALTFFEPLTPGVGFRRVEHLLRASQSLVRMESLEELLPELLELAQDVTGAEAASILMYDEAAGELFFHRVIEPEGEEAVGEALAGVRLKLGEGVAGAVAQSRRSMLVNDASREANFSPRADNATGFVTRALICSPLLYQDELLGVIEVVNAAGRDAFSEEDVKVLECFGCLAALSIKRAQMLAQRDQQRQLEAQFQAAASIQHSFLPRLGKECRDFCMWGVSRPATFVGGDLYDIIPLADGSVVGYVADVSGKGLPASLIMAALWAHLRAEVMRRPDPGELLTSVNRDLAETLFAESHFVTVAAARFWPKTGAVKAALAGHPPPMLAGADGVREYTHAAALPLGTLADTAYPEFELTLTPGDSLVLYSDGVYEAQRPDGSMIGLEAVARRLAAMSAPPRGELLLEWFDDQTRGAEPGDDLTILELWRMT